MRTHKTVNICLTAAAFAVVFAFAVNAGDAVKDNIVKNNLSDTELSGGKDTVTVHNVISTVDTVGNVSNVSNVSNADTVSNVSNADTIDNVNTVSNVDTINTINNVSNADTINDVDTVNNRIINDSDTATGKRPPTPKINAEPPKLSGAYWGLELGLSVGTVPIFPMWQKHFPDSLQHLGLSPTFAADTGDAALLRYRVTESPDAFNFTMPFCLSLYNIGEKRVFSLAVSFFRNSKEFQSELSISSDDTTARRINILERLVYYSVSIEAAGRWAIPPAFFSIDGTQQTFLTIAVGASPVNFVRESEINTNFNLDGDTRMRLAADSVNRKFAALSGNGLSLSWRIGVSAIKRYQSGYGAEFGILYNGAYGNYFHSDGVRLTEAHIKTRGVDLNAENVVNGKPLSFISSQAEFRMTLLVPTKRNLMSE